MSRPMINATLFNVGTENDEYQELRQQMVEELTGDEMDEPLDTQLGMLENYLLTMFADFDDDTLQNLYDNLKEAKEPTIEEVVEEYAEELRAEGHDVETMIVDQEDIENLMKEKN